MKIFKSIFVALFCVLTFSFGLTACGEENIKVNFKKETNQIVMGESYDPFHFLNYDEQDKSKIYFVSGDENVFFITPDNRLVAQNTGKGVLYAYAGEHQLAHSFISVEQNYIQLDAPVNIHYDTKSKSLIWNLVYADTQTGTCVAPSYTVEISKNNQPPQTFETLSNYFVLEEQGFYNVRVKANGGGIFLESNYMSNENGEDLYYSFCVMAQPSNLNYDEQTQTLTWSNNGNPDETLYKVYVNGENISGEGQSTLFAKIDTSLSGIYDLQVEALPVDCENFSAYSQSLLIKRLYTPQLSFNNGLLSWNSQQDVKEYVVNIDDKEDIIVDGKQSSILLDNVSAGNHVVSVKAKGDANQFVYDSDSQSYTFEKLPDAYIVYNKENKSFVIQNSQQYQTILQVLLGDVVIANAEDNQLNFTANNTSQYSIKAQILANNPEIQIDGNVVTNFYLLDDVFKNKYTYIQNLSSLDIIYFEYENQSYINFTELNPSSTYTWNLNEKPFSLIEVENPLNSDLQNSNNGNSEKFYCLGETSSLFVDNLSNLLSVEISNTSSLSTLYIENSGEIKIDKLPTPKEISLQDLELQNKAIIQVEDEISASGYSKTDIKVNGITSGEIIYDSNNIFDISVQFIAKTNCDFVEATDNKIIKQYYTNSDIAHFFIEKLQNPDNLNFNYLTKTLSWNEVLYAIGYNIVLNDSSTQFTQTNSYQIINEDFYNIDVVAVAEDLGTIQNKETKYINSNPVSYKIIMANELKNLSLTLNENKSISLNWDNVEGVSERVVGYNIYLNQQKLTQTPITENFYNIPADNFQAIDDYEIKLEMCSVNNDFFIPQNFSLTKVVTKLPTPETMTYIEESGYQFVVNGFDEQKMNGIILSVNNQESQLINENNINISSINDAVGVDFIVTVGFNGIFDNQQNKYFLNSNMSNDFVFVKLQNPNELNYSNKTFSWTSLDIDNFSQPETVFTFEYFTQTDEQSSSQTTNQTSVVLEITNQTTFFVREKAINDLKNVNTNSTIYLNSDYSQITVYQENSVQNLKMELIENSENGQLSQTSNLTTENKEVKISWNYTALNQDDTDIYFTIKLLKSNNNQEDDFSELSSYSGLINQFFDESNSLYYYVFNMSNFNDVGCYKVEVFAYSDKTLPASSQSLNINKISGPEQVTLTTIRNDLNNSISSIINLLNNNSNTINLNGVAQIELSGAFDLILSSTEISQNVNNSFDKAMFELPSSLGVGQHQINILLKAISPDVVEDGNYYLDSNLAGFNVVKLETISPLFNSETNSLSWESKIGADAYDILINMASSEDLKIFDIKQTTKNLDEYKNILNQSGQYSVLGRVVPLLNQQSSLTLLTENNQFISSVSPMYIASEFSSSTIIQKLESVDFVKVSTSQNDILQQNVSISWDNVANAEIYEIYLSSNVGELGEKIAQISASVGQTSSYDLDSKLTALVGDYFVSVVSVANGFINSQPSIQTQITRLETTSDLYLNDNLCLVWEQTSQTILGKYDFNYVIRILNNENLVLFTSQDLTTTNNMFDINLNETLKQIIQNFDGGKLKAELIIVGNGLSQSKNQIATLSSSIKQVELYKFLKPEIQLINDISSDKLIFETTDILSLENSLDFIVSVLQKNDNGDITVINAQRIAGSVDDLGEKITAQLVIPNEWSNGNYEIVAFVSPKQNIKNFIPSKNNNLVVSKLNAPDEISFNARLGETTSNEYILQTNAQLTWNKVENATSYKIFINNVLTQTFIPEIENLNNEQFSVILSGVFVDETTYSINIQAFGDGFIRSLMSQTFTVVKLNSFENQNSVILSGAQVDKNLKLTYVLPYQSSQTNGLYLEINSLEGDLLYSETIIDTSSLYYDLSSIDELLIYLNQQSIPIDSGKDFVVLLTILGTGVGGVENQISQDVSLSSSKVKILVHKLSTPNLQIVDDVLIINSQDDNDYANQFEYNYSITINGKVVQSGVYNGGILINPSWENGDYQITAYATAKQDVYNLINSSFQSYNPEKLQQVTNLKVESVKNESDETLNIQQEYVYYKFNSVLNATNYDIYVNDVLFKNIQSTVNGEIQTQPFNNLTNAGIYKIKVVAKANGFISSQFSNEITVVRLNPINTATLSNSVQVDWQSVAQNSNHYSYALQILSLNNDNSELNVEATAYTNNNSTLSYSDFVNNNWLNSFVGGNFQIRIFVKGNGSPDSSDNVTTLSSSGYVFTALKLFAPDIYPQSDHLEINNNLSVSQIPNGDLTVNSSHILYSVKFGNQSENSSFALDENGNPLNNILYNENDLLYWPEAWLAGSYTFFAKAYPNDDVINVIASSEESFISLRLNAPTGIKFYRSSDISLEEYSSDNPNFNSSEYVSPDLFLGFDSVEYAKNYVITNVSQSFNNLPNGYNPSVEVSYHSTNLALMGELNNVIRAGSGTRTIGIHVVAEGGAIINSPKAYLNYEILNPIQTFIQEQGNAVWNSVDNASYYLIKATDEVGTQRFWQNTATTTSSYLNGLLENLTVGQIAFNIKPIGNVGVLKSSSTNVSTNLTSGTTIFIDGEYMDFDTEFVKLATPTDLIVNYGFIMFNTVENADSYYAEIYDESSLFIASVKLENIINYFEDIEQIDYIVDSKIINKLLVPSVLYKIKIKAVNSNGNYIHSDFTETINIKILPNANAIGDIKLNRATNSMLNSQYITAWASANSYGSVIDGGALYSIKSVSTKYTEKSLRTFDVSFKNNTVQFNGYSFIVNVASVGSSALETDSDNVTQFYYLTSDFTSSQQIKVLRCPIISIHEGTITWTISEGADGYYVYINDNLYGGGLYKENFLTLPDIYGDAVNNTKINIQIIAVSESLDYLCSPIATYTFYLSTEEEYYEIDGNLLKLKTPNNLVVRDGALIWENGLENVVNLLEDDFANLVNAVTTDDVSNLQNYILNLLSAPINLYSEYIGFTMPSIEMEFTNVLTSDIYKVRVSAENFLTLTANQLLKINELYDLVNVYLSEVITKIENEEYEYETEVADYIKVYYQMIINFFGSQEFKNILSVAEKENGWPNKNLLFDELVYNQITIPSGQYTLRISQIGNDFDWLTSNFTNQMEIFIPNAPQNVKIVEQDGSFLLQWDDVAIPSQYNYSPKDVNSDGQGEKYIIYAEDVKGNRIEILRTNGTNGYLMLNLTELIDQDILTHEHTSIFITVAGDNKSVLQGLMSEKLEISILPQVNPYMNDGVLAWDSLPIASGYNIIASAEGYETLTYFKYNQLTFTGDLFQNDVVYSVSLRAVGQIITTIQDDQIVKTTYVLSGKEVVFKLSKLNTMNVEVNKFGVFEWRKVDNADGFVVTLAGTNISVVWRDGGVATNYESSFEGYYNYQFKALGSNGNINFDNLERVYYLNSSINNNGLGILGTNLPSITNVWVENGVIKFKPLQNVNCVQPDGLTKVIGYKLTIDNGIGALYTTDLSTQEFYTDNEGNICFDFTNYGFATTYKLIVQPYIYFVNDEQTIFENAQITYNKDSQNYHLLLGGKLSLTFDKANSPTNLHIENGEVVWEGEDDVMFNVEISTSTTVVLSEWTDSKSWWTENDLILPNVNYYVKVKAFKDGMVYSQNAIFINTLTGDMQIVNKLSALDLSVNTYSNPDGETFIAFDYPTGTLDIGFNLMFKPLNQEDFMYLDINNEHYNNVISYLNGTATISLKELANVFDLTGIEEMEYAIQIVPKGKTSYLKSNYSKIFDFSIPDKISNIYYDENNYEFYWQHVGSSYSYVVNDEILDSDNNVIAIYRYKIKSSNITTEEYYQERQIEIDGVSRYVGTISYIPSISGYNHRISVAVCLDTSANQSLMSLFQTCETNCYLDVIHVENNLFDKQSPIYQTINNLDIVSYLQNNAYGSVNNPYLISNEIDFANINYRLVRYNYTQTYDVELFYKFGNDDIHKTLTITESDATTYTFKQTADLNLVNVAIGAIKTLQSGTVNYKYFGNTYDANNHSITYTFDITSMVFAKTNFNVGLFYGLTENGVVKNLKLDATIDFANKPSAIINFGSVCGINNGLIENVQLNNLQVLRLIDENGTGVKTLTFGGLVAENFGKVNLCITSNIELSLSLASNGDALYVGGIVAKNTSGTIQQVGNNITFVVVGKTQTYVGGVVGFNTGILTQSYNKANLTASSTGSNSNTYIGGLVAYNDSQGYIQNSYFVGELNTPTYTSTNNSKIYIGGISAYTRSSNITNNFTNMPEIRNQGVAVCGTIVGQLATTIPSNFTLTNYYVNNSAYGGSQGSVGTKFVQQVSQAELQQYATILNNKAQMIIYKNSVQYPIFVWEENF